ncbi:MAG: hypothetical protein EBS36_00150 [Actinobacteria bacterium]|nr:hypothetical protein [Actinomycetota bacterium]
MPEGPGEPLGPGAPEGPGCPAGPRLPISPRGPTEPGSPCTPSLPSSPAWPSMPSIPSVPDIPGSPTSELRKSCIEPSLPAASHKSYALAPSQIWLSDADSFLLKATGLAAFELLGHADLSLIF